ncbi:ligand-binding sensor domain-containing protein [Flavobacterium sp. P21]|uniref:ligand-binding sensor domain-containing protein n=1 Tax=Flavobacterium sp. P21 TaxID=3423948 RepID=UPI003D677F6F
MSVKNCVRAIVILFFIVNNLFSQNKFENYQFRLVDKEASKSGIYTISQDQLGFMWMGTNGAGLYKYDGVNYIAYEQNSKLKNSINSNLIYATYVDTRNRLWIGTDEGLCLYNRNLDNFESIDIQKKIKKETVISIKSIIEDNNGNLMLGTVNNGLLKLNTTTREITKVHSDVPNNSNYLINSLAKDKKGTIYLGTNLGLKIFDPIKNETKKVDIDNDSRIHSASIVSMCLDSNQNLWIGDGFKGLIKVDLHSKVKQAFFYPITKKGLCQFWQRIPKQFFVLPKMMV